MSEANIHFNGSKLHGNFNDPTRYWYCHVQVKTLQGICHSYGMKDATRMSKADCITHLRKKLGVPENFQKIFTKIWGASGRSWFIKHIHHG